ncbi:hypothetical protein [Brevibacillus fulvus]|uniref:Uncharacterized protein n=1 Tax=Brevibacillus fulvus TaxID=1125967 RepID=A0A939BWF5_9BACL|nr:hypothetical protein [Brevibacillus fulvus]MBM7591766.1 hypothetical protein [Brevibacillus fulvus]
MLDYNDKDFNKKVAFILYKIAERVENDQELAKYLLEQYRTAFSSVTDITFKDDEKQSIVNVVKDNIETDISDVFSIFSKEGAEGLRNNLEQYDIEAIKKIVAVNGLDPSQKVRRWKTKVKIIDFVVEVIEKKMSHGSAFIDEN